MAYWGEAMSHNHPLWAEVDVDKAKTSLEKLAPTVEARVAKAKTHPRKKPSSKPSTSSSTTPGDNWRGTTSNPRPWPKCTRRWPDDNEVSVLLFPVAARHRASRRHRIPPAGPAASIAMKVFRKTPRSRCGALHHSLVRRSRPCHSSPARRARLWPHRTAAAHARTCPRTSSSSWAWWPDVAASNTVAYKAAKT